MGIKVFLIVFCIVLLICSILFSTYLFLKYKNNKTRPLINKILITFSVFLILFNAVYSLPLSILNVINVKPKFSNYTHINVEEMFIADKSKILFYSAGCELCANIEKDIDKNFFNDNEFYCVNVDLNKDKINFPYKNQDRCEASGGTFSNYCSIKYEEYIKKMYKVNDYTKFYLVGTPSLVIVKDYAIDDVLIGDKMIKNFF